MNPHPMTPQILGRATVLARGALQPITDGRGSCVQCLSGTLWLTQQGEVRDIVLEAGDMAVIERNGTSIVFALSDARFVLTDELATIDVKPRPRQARAELPPVGTVSAS